jgi:hypothetical protein
VQSHFGQNSQETHERQGEMTEKLYLYDVANAAPRFYVIGKTVYRLNGEAVYTIDGAAKTMTPIGATEPVFQIKCGWIYAGGRAILYAPQMERIPGWRWQVDRRGQHGRVTESPRAPSWGVARALGRARMYCRARGPR